MGGEGVIVDEEVLKSVRALIEGRRDMRAIKGIAVALILAPEPLTTAIGAGILGLTSRIEGGPSIRDLFEALSSELDELDELTI